jgi:hypothetical protein
MRRKLHLVDVLIFALLLWPAPVSAHHVVSEYGIAWTEPVSLVELDVQTAEFDFGERRGYWAVTALSLEYAFEERLSGSVRLPFAWIAYADHTDAVGVADIEFGSKVRLVATSHGELILSAGAGIELPTGDVDNGLGSGHFELSPYVSASSAPLNTLVLYALAAERIALGTEETHAEEPGQLDHDHPHEGSVLNPHQKHELFSRLGAAQIFGPVYVSAGCDVVVVWSGGQTLGPVVLRSEFGWLPHERVRLALGGDVNVAGEERFSWRARMGVAWMF